MKNGHCYELEQPFSVARQTPAGFWGALQRIPAQVFDILLLWQERADQRAQLASLDARALRDIGLSRADVEREVSLPFWRG